MTQLCHWNIHIFTESCCLKRALIGPWRWVLSYLTQWVVAFLSSAVTSFILEWTEGVLKSIHMHTWLQKRLRKRFGSHGHLTPLVAHFIPGVAGTQLPFHPADVLNQSAEHGTRGHPVGFRFEEGLWNRKLASVSSLLLYKLNLTVKQCFAFEL